jgi:Domain of unknown function (DUF4159)
MSRLAIYLLISWIVLGLASEVRAASREEVERAIRNGIQYLKGIQKEDGSWAEVDNDSIPGTTCLVTLALLNAGEPTDSLTISRALQWLRKFEAAIPARVETPRASLPGQAKVPEKKPQVAVDSGSSRNSVYAISLQTTVFAAAGAEQDRERIARNARWLEAAQIGPGRRAGTVGSWSYKMTSAGYGDNSNSFYALLGLEAAAEAGFRVRNETWTLADESWSNGKRKDGGWSYTLQPVSVSTASMTCEGIASLILARTRRNVGEEHVERAAIVSCGNGVLDRKLTDGIDWMAAHFQVNGNFGASSQWKYYYLHALERVGHLSGRKYIGKHDWFREGADELIHTQDKAKGSWQGMQLERAPAIATSFALLFLSRGRAPVLVQKASHAPGIDWMNDLDDVRNLVKTVSCDWKQPLNWQIADLNDVQAVLNAVPIMFLNGHFAPELTEGEKMALRTYVEKGGFILAEACCGRAEFDKGFREIVSQIVPDPASKLLPIADEHPVWRAPHAVKPGEHPLWGVESGGRTVLIYSPGDLSCGWNQRDRSPDSPVADRALQVGQNIVDYATGRKPPPDKLAAQEAR